MAKRYVLLKSDSELDEDDLGDLAEALRTLDPRGKVIPIKGSGMWVVLKTNVPSATRIRQGGLGLRAGEHDLISILTSGAIGKLKKRAQDGGPTAVGKVPE